MRQAILNGYFSPFRFGLEGGPTVSLLQFADETIFIGDASIENVFL